MKELKEVNKKAANNPKLYSIKGVKSFMGTEGHGFNASLYRDGKKVAFIIDSANGGEYDYQWSDWKEPKVDINVTSWMNGEPITFKGTPEEKILYEHIETLPPIAPDDIITQEMKMDKDIFVSRLIEKYESERWMKRQLKNKFLFQIGTEIGNKSYQTFKKSSGMNREQVIGYIKKTYPNKKYILLG